MIIELAYDKQYGINRKEYRLFGIYFYYSY